MSKELLPTRALSAAESRLLLRGAAGAGHIGLSVHALPVVLPVSFTVDDDAVTVWGSALDRGSVFHVGDVVAFQVDGRDPEGGWSVLVRGRAEVASDGGTLSVRIPAELVDGQRF
jgi:nitroimidazol reductase NimA-like FMN-containing flavoprotein (pyridoxamine 5'-phosphate oxidase superfamily)